MPKRTHQSQSTPVVPVNLAATADGTARFAERWASRYVADFFRRTQLGFAASSVAIGTYLGESDDATDEMYAEALRTALSSGVNVVDTAINYRCQRSERVIGRVLQDLMADGIIRRDEMLLCTKAGYIPLDGNPPASRDDYESYIRREYVDAGIIDARELVAGGHCIAPQFLLDQMRRSMRNLGVQRIDCFYVHNPEQQLAAISATELIARLRRAFEALEGCVQRGEITTYGCATWSGLR
ncbi:MAG TPA: aldo/keto reductase, partial [Gemmatimonadaceae bacterium]|nr:aldo/keto reductase [Gemmatimonadaceae bacterium]